MADEKVKVVFDLEDKVSDKAKGMQKETGSLFNSFTVGAAAVVGVGYAIGKMIDAAEESRQVMAQTEAVIKSTGGAAGLSADEVGKMASELQKTTNFTDEQVQSGQNMLLTFTNIGKEAFPLATNAAVDMAAALGTDVKSASLQLGKALQDPIEGLTALKRSGVSFTESQKEQIKVLQMSGDIMGAQKVILNELSEEFGGSAVAVASPFIQMQNAIGDISEALGGVLTPILAVGAQAVTKLTYAFVEFINGVDPKPAAKAIKIFLVDVETDIKVKAEIFKSFIANPFKWETYAEIFKNLGSNISGFWTSIKSFLSGSFNAITDFWKKSLEDQGNSTLTLEQKITAIKRDGAAKVEAIERESLVKKKDFITKETQYHYDGVVKRQAQAKEGLDKQLTAHKEHMSQLRLDNAYTTQLEIDSLERIGKIHNLSLQDSSKLRTMINELRVKESKETTDKLVADEERLFQRKKEFGEYSLAEEIKSKEALLANHKITATQREDIELKLFKLKQEKTKEEYESRSALFSKEMKESELLGLNKEKRVSLEEKMMGSLFEMTRNLGDKKMSLEEQMAKGALNFVKRELIARVDAMAVAWGIEAGARIVGSWGLDAGAWGLLGAAAAASSGIRSAVNGIQLAEGGIVQARPGGIMANIGEGGRDEAVIPLGSKKAQSALEGVGANGSQSVIILADDGTQLAKAIYRKQTEMIRTGQLAARR